MSIDTPTETGFQELKEKAEELLLAIQAQPENIDHYLAYARLFDASLTQKESRDYLVDAIRERADPKKGREMIEAAYNDAKGQVQKRLGSALQSFCIFSKEYNRATDIGCNRIQRQL